MAISINETTNKNFETTTSSTLSTEKSSSSFISTLKETTATINAQNKEERELTDLMLEQIDKIATTGVKYVEQDKIDEILNKIQENLRSIAKKNFSNQKLETLLERIQSMADNILEDLNSPLLDITKIQGSLKDIYNESQKLLDETQDLSNLSGYSSINTQIELLK